MSEAEDRRSRIKQSIAASQDRLNRESGSLPALPRREPLPDRYPPEDYRSLAAEYPMLTVAAGIGLGLLAGAILPKGAGGKAGRRAMGLAAAAAELGLVLSKQARDRAADAGRDGLSELGERTTPLRQRAVRAGGSARSKGVRLAGEAIRLAAKLRK
ncbi:MAG: hypothetical protein ABL914_10430 [Novosphingobium sp.]|uniref:hypothetical protein n=1 Tax=Novosphingobium sp. TaxID=1874826 RepID=UPI0032BB74DD